MTKEKRTRRVAVIEPSFEPSPEVIRHRKLLSQKEALVTELVHFGTTPFKAPSVNLTAQKLSDDLQKSKQDVAEKIKVIDKQISALQQSKENKSNVLEANNIFLQKQIELISNFINLNTATMNQLNALEQDLYPKKFTADQFNDKKTVINEIYMKTRDKIAPVRAELTTEQGLAKAPELQEDLNQLELSLARIDALMVAHKSLMDKTNNSGHVDIDTYASVTNTHLELQNHALEMDQRGLLIKAKLALLKQDTLIKEKHEELKRKTEPLYDIYNRLYLMKNNASSLIQDFRNAVTVTSTTAQQAKPPLAEGRFLFHGIDDIAIELTPTTAMQLHNHQEVKQHLKLQRKQTLDTLDVRLQRVDETLKTFSGLIAAEKARAKEIILPTIEFCQERLGLLSLNEVSSKQIKNALDRFHALMNTNFLELPPEKMGVAIQKIAYLYYNGDGIERAGEIFNSLKKEIETSKSNFLKQHPELKLDKDNGDQFTYNGKTLALTKLAKSLVENKTYVKDFLDIHPEFPISSQLKQYFSGENTANLEELLNNVKKDYVEAHCCFTKAFAKGCTPNTDYSKALEKLQAAQEIFDALFKLNLIIEEKLKRDEKIRIAEELLQIKTESKDERNTLLIRLQKQQGTAQKQYDIISQILAAINSEYERVQKEDPQDPRLIHLENMKNQLFLPIASDLKTRFDAIGKTIKTVSQLGQAATKEQFLDDLATCKKDLPRYVRENNCSIDKITGMMREHFSEHRFEELTLQKQNAFISFIDQWIVRPLLELFSFKRSDSLFATKMEQKMAQVREKILPQSQAPNLEKTAMEEPSEPEKIIPSALHTISVR